MVLAFSMLFDSMKREHYSFPSACGSAENVHMATEITSLFHVRVKSTTFH